MDILVERVGTVDVATVIAEDLDAGNVADFKREMAPVIDGNTKVVVDLSHVRFVDSSGLGAFISFLRKLNARDGDLKLCGLSKTVLAVFELVRLHRVFDIFGSAQQAVRAFEPARHAETSSNEPSRS